MQNSTAILDPDQARFNATADVQSYLRQHGASICDLLDALEDPTGFSALCDLHMIFGQLFPDPEAVESALGSILRILAGLAPSALDQIGQQRNMPVSDMTMWHGARLSELRARFHHAKKPEARRRLHDTREHRLRD